jgi:(S)-ureidoglycine aminohydrolase
MSGDEHGWENAGDTPVTYYVFRYRSKALNVKRGRIAGDSFMVDWDDIEFKKSDIGGRRQNFDRATSMYERFEMHVSTLNEGLTNHQVHKHRAEEFVLILRGEVEMPVGDSTFKASRGDLIFLASQMPHALNNTGNGQTEYFAFQWQ